MRHPILFPALACLACLASSPAAFAARPADRGSVSGVGQAAVERVPETLRMQIDLTGKGKTLSDALDALKKRREAATKQLTALGVDKDSIKVGPPQQTADASEQTKQLAKMMAAKFRQAGRDPKSLALPTTYAVSASLTADWRLKGTSPDQQLLDIAEIKGKVDAADLAGLKEAKTLTPEEQELSEEMETRHDNYGREERTPGTPIFTAVLKLTDAERDKLLAQACAKAKAQAARLAKAAGGEIGNPHIMEGQIGLGASEQQAYYRQMQMNYGGYQGDDSNSDDAEIVGPVNGQISVRALVRATFELK